MVLGETSARLVIITLMRMPINDGRPFCRREAIPTPYRPNIRTVQLSGQIFGRPSAKYYSGPRERRLKLSPSIL